MDTDRNLLFGVLALQAGLIDAAQFVEACTLWASRKNVGLADLLVERGWILPADRGHLEYLLRRNVERAGGARASLAAIPDEAKRALAALGDAEIEQSLGHLQPTRAQDTSADHAGQAPERYGLVRLHATGGIGRVWLARDHALERDVALKELRPEQAHSPALAARFLQEARVTGQLEHPGVVPVYELVQPAAGRQPFYAMRFVRGRTLSEAARAHRRKQAAGQADPVELLALLNAFVTVCNTVAYAHSRGVLHRDLKGQNVLLGDFGEVLVLDWGLAKRLHGPGERQPAEPDAAGSGPAGDTDLTVQGQALGTPAYMAPEQAAGRVDLGGPRTDVYGLGAVLYEVLTGRPPFSGADTAEVLRKVQEEEPAPPRRLDPAVPAALEAVCLRALAKEPNDRHASAAQVAQEVQQWMAELAERKRAEQERERFFALSVDLMCIAGFDGYFKQLNPAWERTLGWTIAELLSRPWLDFVHPDDARATVAAARQIIEGQDLPAFENRYRCRDGSYRWLLWSSREIVGQQTMFAIARDITEHKRILEALRDSEERYRSVMASMRDGVVLFDADGGIRACNPSAERILGLTAAQITGRTARDPRWRVVHEDGSPFAEEDYPVMVTLRTGRPCPDQVLGVHKPDGSLTWVSINAQPLFREGQAAPYAVVSTFSDISRRRQLERELEDLRRRAGPPAG
jgi:serine/threonine-protein kinase